MLLAAVSLTECFPLVPVFAFFFSMDHLINSDALNFELTATPFPDLGQDHLINPYALPFTDQGLNYLPKMQPEASELTDIHSLLKNLIESAQQSWNYSIFWRVSLSEHGPLLVWDYGYPNWCITFRHLLWIFAEGSGLPVEAWQSSLPVWITGRENLASSSWARVRKAQEYGIRTLVFIPSEIGVIELGSAALNFQSMDVVNKAVQLLNSFHGSKMFPPVQPGDESESSNSIENSAIVRSNTHLSNENAELSLGLHLGYKAWPVKPQYESKSSSSSVGNYPVPVVKEKEKPQFSGKLQVGSDNHSADSSDINAFIQILKGRRG